MIRIFFKILGLILIIVSCEPETPPYKEYLFLGHPYSWKDSFRVDQRVEQLDFSKFDQIWLGGDICSHTTKKSSTLDYLDSLFDLSADHCHWALGNHDVLHGNVNLIRERTKRNTFYVTCFDNVCLLVLNTNLLHIFPGIPPQTDCEEKEAQLDLILAVTDTIQRAKNLVILHHLGLFNELKKDAAGAKINDFNTNPEHIRATCDSASDFTKLVYPRLVKVQEKGIQVSLIGGDLGMNAKTFSYKTEEGIWFLGAGINNSVNPEFAPEYVSNFDPDKLLIIRNYPSLGKLEWNFVLLNELIE